MKNLSKLLRDSDRSDGFSLYQVGGLATLVCHNLVIASFLYNKYGEEELKDKVHSFIEIDRYIYDYSAKVLQEFEKENINVVKNTICKDCDVDCSRMCKFAKSIIDKMSFERWMSKVVLN